MSFLTGRVALVTGASRGIGFAIARALLAEGATVAITATDESRVQRAAADLSAGGGTVLPLQADVRSHPDTERAVAAVVERFGGLDVVVNNAGVGVFRPVADMTVDEWQRILDTNVTGVFHVCRAALPHLRARGGGWIINISSLSGKNPFADGAAYCASKAALNAFSEALMQEVRHDGIRVAYVLPGSVRTEFTGPSKSGDEWKLSPDDVAEVVTDLLAHQEIRPSTPPRKG